MYRDSDRSPSQHPTKWCVWLRNEDEEKWRWYRAPFRVTSKGLGLRRVREIRAWETEPKESGFAAQKSTVNTVDLR